MTKGKGSLVSKSCQQCDRKIPTDGRRKYCSDNCKTEAYNQRLKNDPIFYEKKLERTRAWRRRNPELVDDANKKRRKPPVVNKKCEGCEILLPATTGRNRRKKYCSDKCMKKVKDKKRWNKIKDNPEARKKQNEIKRNWRLKNIDHVREYDRNFRKENNVGKKYWEKLKNDPERLARKNKKRNEQWAKLPLEKRKEKGVKSYESEKRRQLDPEYKARISKRNTKWQMEKYHADPEWKKKRLAESKKWREKHFADPENRKKQLEKTKQHYRNNIEYYRKYKREHAAKPENKEKARNQPSYIRAVMGCPGEEVPAVIIDAKRNLLKIRRLYTEGNKFRTDIVSSRK